MKPILFSTPMVKAILAGEKTQTRRVVKPQPRFEKCERGPNFWHWKDCQWADGGLGMPQSGIDDYAPYQPGDILWVRETWGKEVDPDYHDKLVRYLYKADGHDFSTWRGLNGERFRWRPSIHMPREAARLFLEVREVRYERLQDISEHDVRREGYGAYHYGFGGISHINKFIDLWNTLNTKQGYSWASNPWVWVYEFERVEKVL